MKISIITVCYNSVATVSGAVESVLHQQGVEVEYIIVDGGSTDGTVECLKEYGAAISSLTSEPDRGIYDAMNKGIARATGDVVGLLNSDDFYASDGVLARVAELFDRDGVDAVYGDLHYVSQDDDSKVVRDWRSGPLPQALFSQGWHPPHPSFFVRRSVYDALGSFDLRFDIAADYEFMLRVLEKNKVSCAYLPEVLVKMRMGEQATVRWQMLFERI